MMLLLILLIGIYQAINAQPSLIFYMQALTIAVCTHDKFKYEATLTSVGTMDAGTNLTATIHWNDGHHSPMDIESAGNTTTFTLCAHHTYRSSGGYNVVVSVLIDDNSTLTSYGLIAARSCNRHATLV